MLKEVTITHRDSCKTYPLRRIGLSHLINWETDTPTIKELCDSDMFEHLETPEIGCILVWRGKDKDSTTGYITQHKITEDGHILSLRRFDYGHCGVYEGNDTFSDCRFEEGEGTRIHLRYMNDVSKPDYILKLKTKQL